MKSSGPELDKLIPMIETAAKLKTSQRDELQAIGLRRFWSDMDNQLFGVHAIYEALAAGNPPIERIYVGRETRSPKLQEVIDLARAA